MNGRVERAELKEANYNAPFNKDMWYAFSVYVPEESPEQYVRCLIAQWYAPADKELGEANRSPPLGIEYRSGRFKIRYCHSSKRIQKDNSLSSINKTTLYNSSEYAQKGVWHDFIVNVNWSYEKNGYCNIWIDGNKVVEHKGPIGYNDRLGPLFKMGIYRDPTHEQFVIYHDDYKRGFSPSEIGVEDIIGQISQP